ncbi:predicted protein [Nematostella vectensis]|uniref:Transcription cofactor HES-6 n=1 Tax=Nematostella vectensis TaxID=45351 RepID=A7S152_NEMVE|nr:predicted protein [Nematostella vectensis]|eukprot:XP_001634598.1 predicted protein [Nematostella vectensis]
MADKSFDKVLKNRQCKLANKSSKPLLERQRRARINHSLNELKTLVLSSLYQNCPQAEQNCEKMEKAEILELTVNFLKVIQSRRNTVMPRPDLGKAHEFHHVKMEQMSPEQANARQHPIIRVYHKIALSTVLKGGVGGLKTTLKESLLIYGDLFEAMLSFLNFGIFQLLKS